MMLDCQTYALILIMHKFIDLDFSSIENSIKHDLKTFALDLVNNLKGSLQKII